MPECAHSISDQPWNISANSQSMFAAGQPADLAAAPLLPSLGPPSFNTILLSLTGLLPRPSSGVNKLATVLPGPCIAPTVAR